MKMHLPASFIRLNFTSLKIRPSINSPLKTRLRQSPFLGLIQLRYSLAFPIIKLLYCFFYGIFRRSQNDTETETQHLIKLIYSNR